MDSCGAERDSHPNCAKGSISYKDNDLLHLNTEGGGNWLNGQLVGVGVGMVCNCIIFGRVGQIPSDNCDAGYVHPNIRVKEFKKQTASLSKKIIM